MALEFCGIAAGLGLSCDTKRQSIGGSKQRLWIGNLSELEEAVEGAVDGIAGYVNSLTFTETYAQLYEFAATLNSVVGTDAPTRTDEGNGIFTHTVTFNLLDLTPADRKVIEDMTLSDGLYAIIERTASRQFEIFGLPQGLTLESGEGSTGATAEDSTARVMTLSGAQSALRKVFLAADGEYSSTLDLLNGYAGN